MLGDEGQIYDFANLLLTLIRKIARTFENTGPVLYCWKDGCEGVDRGGWGRGEV